MTTYLITSHPYSYRAKVALKTVSDALTAGDRLRVFFYGDGAYLANRLVWQTKDVPNLAQAWTALADKYQLALPVCVSTALARGITDADNAQRHGLEGENLLSPFYLVGLSELAMMLSEGELVQL